MNPSHYPQVLRSRSRSPSPVPRQRDTVGDVGDIEVVGNTGFNSELSKVQKGNRLFVPKEDLEHGHRLRSYSTNDRRIPRRVAQRCGIAAELENMANVEIVNAYHSINDGDRHHLMSDEEQDNNPNPDGDAEVIFTTPRHTILNPRGTDNCPGNRERRSASCSRGSYGTASDSCSNYTPDQVDQLRRRVKFFFMDPNSKFKARRHIPWKMFLQVLKIVIITVQLVQFGGQRSTVVQFFEHNKRTLEHLLLKDWDYSFETMPYPPATGTYALYTVDALLDHIDNAWTKYYNLSDASLATINLLRDKHTGNPLPIRLCNRFDDYDDFHNGTYIVGPGVIYNCTQLVPLEGNSPYNIRAFLQQENITIPYNKLLELTLEFRFTTFHLNLIETHYGPTCYSVNTTIRYRNYERSGQVLIELTTTNRERDCAGKIMTPGAQDDERKQKVQTVVFDSFVIIVCILSSILCARSLVRAWQLKRKVEKLFKHRYGKRLVFSDRMEFVNLWYFLIIINDIFTIIGSSYKIQLELRTVTITSYNYDWCSLFLGLGCLMAWIGCLRYLGYFKKYNILILTLKTAFPNMLRFMVCALAMYFGFMFCGWVILSPYHIKFRHLSTTSECLYSLVNGDDMFVTFSATETTNNMVWYFSRIYLYVFISLFIYCVLSLFISVIMDTYETLKEYYEKGFPKTDLQLFLEQCNAPLKSGLYRRQHTENEAKKDFSLIECFASCCCKHRDVDEPEERRRLLTRTI